MNLREIIKRQPQPDPWAEGETIPWNEPGFSSRMLGEHLTQDHDAASRRSEIIDAHVEWIHSLILRGRPSRILDLGCGPGLYTSRLARLGHRCVGIDFSPAAIAYATERAACEELDCTYVQEDIRSADYGRGHDLVALVYGEFNVFCPEHARGILRSVHRALAAGGLVLLEVQTYCTVRMKGAEPPSWYSSEGGLFSERPHICLQENFWDANKRVAIERFYVIEVETAAVSRHSISTQAYTDGDLLSLPAECGFVDTRLCSFLDGCDETARGELMVVVAEKQEAG